jgi:hypothetical protein
MESETMTKDDVKTLVDAGSMSLNEYTFVSEKLNEQKANYSSAYIVKPSDDDKPDLPGDTEMPVKFRMNVTGNIFYSTTSPALDDETKKLFESVTVLFAAMTKAITSKGKDLFNYDVWSEIISKSGYFVEVTKFIKTISIKNSALTIDTQIINQLLPGMITGSSLDIAKGVLSSINGEFKKDTTNDSAKIGHLLFICEELFGAPSVTVRLFFGTKQSHANITSSPCHKTSSTSFVQNQEANTFLFVSPVSISQLAENLKITDNAYDDLVNTLSSYIS